MHSIPLANTAPGINIGKACLLSIMGAFGIATIDKEA